jgi:hypothetical protein
MGNCFLVFIITLKLEEIGSFKIKNLRAKWLKH